MRQFELNRTCEYLGEKCKVISVLDNDLLLVLPLKELESGNFPLRPLVIPDDKQGS